MGLPAHSIGPTMEAIASFCCPKQAVNIAPFVFHEERHIALTYLPVRHVGAAPFTSPATGDLIQTARRPSLDE